MNYAVIMAGGTGKRLWPLSRRSRPKQVLELIEGQTLLRKCYDRLTPLFAPDHILVLTNSGYADIVRRNLPELPQDNIISEPAVRDTAGAIGLAATVLTKYDPDAVMTIVTADQLIRPVPVFQSAVSSAIEFVKAKPEAFVVFGIPPTSASTQLGYIKLGSKVKSDTVDAVFAVEAFREKPDSATACEYLRTGRYCWNSGMFVWKAAAILESLAALLPATVEPLKKIHAAWAGPYRNDVLNQFFPKLPKISIDYAVMEKASNVYAVKLDCRWLDIGSFAALADVVSADKNNNIVIAGKNRLLDCRNNIIVTEDHGHLIAAIGLENIVIAHSPDATLVCRTDDTARLKELLEQIEEHLGGQYL